MARNTLGILIKHNLVKAWQGELDMITYYEIEERECILRLSIPRYLVEIREQYSPMHQEIMENIVIHGSLMKSEILQLRDLSAYPNEADYLKAINELI